MPPKPKRTPRTPPLFDGDIPYLPDGLPKELQDELARDAAQRQAERRPAKPAPTKKRSPRKK